MLLLYIEVLTTNGPLDHTRGPSPSASLLRQWPNPMHLGKHACKPGHGLLHANHLAGRIGEKYKDGFAIHPFVQNERKGVARAPGIPQLFMMPLSLGQPSLMAPPWKSLFRLHPQHQHQGSSKRAFYPYTDISRLCQCNICLPSP